MTNLDAIKAKIGAYEVQEETLEFALMEQELEPSGAYKASNRTAFLRAVISTLYGLLPLKKEKDNGSEVGYDIDGIKALIKRYEDELPAGEQAKKPQNCDMTYIW